NSKYNIIDGTALSRFDTSGNFISCKVLNYSTYADLKLDPNDKNGIYFIGSNSQTYTSGQAKLLPGSHIVQMDLAGNLTNSIDIIAEPHLTMKFDMDFTQPEKPLCVAFNFIDSFAINGQYYN